MDVQNLLNHEDTIALLYADGSGQNDARQCIMNSANAHLAISDRSSRFERRREDEYLPRTSRGQTPPDLDLGRGDPVNGPCLWLRFSRGSKSRMGIVAGCNPNSDIVLPPRRGISWYHFAIQFDQNYNLVIADMDSTCGTTVTYDSHNPGPRVSAKWIIGGNPYLSAVSKITVRASGARFLVKIPRRNPLSSAYRAQVDCFRQSASLNPNFADLQLSRSRPDTRRPTGSHTPTTNPIRIKHELGRGSFGVVYKVWDATTGQLWAEKNALGESFSRSDWKREIDIIRGLNHDHVVKLLAGGLTPRPWIRLEYVAGGSLVDHRERGNPSFSRAECIYILHQGLSALKYFHAQRPPVVHRDIAPKNILLQSRQPMYIKFADFGLSKQSNIFKTVKGTPLYIAPDIYGNSSPRGYTTAVDIWSFGVVIVHLLYGLPEFRSEYSERPGLWWAQIHFYLKRQAEEYSDSFAYFLRNYMLPLDAADRASAAECFDWVQALVTSMESPSQEPEQGFPHEMVTRSSARRQGNSSVPQVATAPAHTSRQNSGSGSRKKERDEFSFRDWINWPSSQESAETGGSRRGRAR